MSTDITKSFDLDPDEILIDSVDLLRALGYTELTAPEPIKDRIDYLLRIALQSIKASGGYSVFIGRSVNVGRDSFTIGNLEFNTGSTIASQLIGAELLAGVVSTAGDEISAVSRGLIKSGEVLDGYIVDVIGSLVAECAADLVESHLEAYAAVTGVKLSNRLSPGYCGWDVLEQLKLFSLLPENFCGVRVNESALMVPIKSISAVAGIGKNIEKGPYPCSICSVERCYMRRKS